MSEEWKPILEFENEYYISNKGRVFSLRNNILLKPKKTKSGYYRVSLSANGRRKECMIHRLVAEAFIPNPEKKLTVNHINENKQDNCIENLEWATQAEQNIHGTRIARVIASTDYKARNINYELVAAKHNYHQINRKQMKPVLQYDKHGIFIARHDGVAAASRSIGISAGHICCCLKGRRISCGGYQWKYA